MMGVLQQVLYLNSDIVAEGRMLAMQVRYNSYCVPYPVKEVGITKGDVFRSRLDLLSDVGQHYVTLNDSELSLIDGDDGAMTAQMLTSSAGFRISNDPSRAVS